MDLSAATESLAAAQRDYDDARRVMAAVRVGTPEYRVAVRGLGEAWYRWRLARQEVKHLRQS